MIKKASVLIVLLLVAQGSYAGKIKSASGFYPQVQKSVEQVENDIEKLKNYLDNIKTTGSFLKTDFWGTLPAWYLSSNHSGLTTHYPFHRFLDSKVKREYRDTFFVRTLKNIALSPIEVDGWTVRVNFNYDFIFDRGGNKYSNPKNTKQELLAHGIAPEKIDEALHHYYDLYMQIENLMINSLVPKLDNLYENTFFGESELNHPILKKVFGKDLGNVKAHPEIIKQNIKNLKIDGLHEALRLETLEELQDKYRKMRLDGGAFDFFFQVSRYSFQVGNNMTDSLKQSNIFDFSQLLETKVKSGQAKVSPYDKSAKFVFHGDLEKIKVYSDAEESLKYKGVVLFDEATGKGVWQTALWQSEDDLKQLASQIETTRKDLKKVILTYLDMALHETILKFKPEASPSSSDDF